MPKASKTGFLFGKKNKAVKDKTKSVSGKPATAKPADGKPAVSKVLGATEKPTAGAAKPTGKASKPEAAQLDPNAPLTDQAPSSTPSAEEPKNRDSASGSASKNNETDVKEIKHVENRAEKALRRSKDEVLAQAIRNMLHKDEDL